MFQFSMKLFRQLNGKGLSHLSELSRLSLLCRLIFLRNRQRGQLRLFFGRSQPSIKFRVFSGLTLFKHETRLHKSTAGQIFRELSYDVIRPGTLLSVEATVEEMSDTFELFGLGSGMLRDCDQ